MIFNAIVYVHYIRTLQRFIDVRSIILAIMPKRIVERRKWHIGLVEEKVKRRKTSHPDYIDFMSHLLQAEEKGDLTMPDLVANANLMVIAGSETTATILSGTIYYLCTHPRVMQKLLDEVRTSFKSSDEINIARISQLKYINAVIDESFRLYPPAAGSHPRITPPEGANILGEWLPGNVCGLSLRFQTPAISKKESHGLLTLLYRHPWAWHNTQSSALHTTSRTQKSICLNDGWTMKAHTRTTVVKLCSHFLSVHGTVLAESTYIFPSSPLSQTCHHNMLTGLCSYSLANIEMRLILAKMLWHFDFTLTPECANWPKDQYIYTSWEKIPLKVHITTRATKA